MAGGAAPCIPAKGHGPLEPFSFLREEPPFPLVGKVGWGLFP